MKIRSKVVMFVFCVMSFTAHAQIKFSEWFNHPFTKADTNFIQADPDRWSLRLNSTYKFNNYRSDFTDYLNPAYHGTYYHGKTSAGFGAGFSFKNFSADVAAKIHPYHTTNNFLINGLKTDMVFSMYNHQHLLDGTVQFYDGYAVKEMHSTVLVDDSVDVHVRNFGLQYNYNFNYKKFSMTAAMMGTEIQKRSAGSFLIGSEVRYRHLFLPNDTSINFRMNLAEAGVGAGYAYTIVFLKHAFLMLNLSPVISYSVGVNDSFNQFKNGITYSLTSRAALGFNIHHLSATLSSIATWQQATLKYNLEDLFMDYGRTKFVLAYRFF